MSSPRIRTTSSGAGRNEPACVLRGTPSARLEWPASCLHAPGGVQRRHDHCAPGRPAVSGRTSCRVARPAPAGTTAGPGHGSGPQAISDRIRPVAGQTQACDDPTYTNRPCADCRPDEQPAPHRVSSGRGWRPYGRRFHGPVESALRNCHGRKWRRFTAVDVTQLGCSLPA